MSRHTKPLGHWAFWDMQLLYYFFFFPLNQSICCLLGWGAHWSAQDRLVPCLLLLSTVFLFFHTWIRFSFHCRIYSMNIVDSSISRPSSASPSGKPSGPAVSMGSVQGHYVQQVVCISTLFDPTVSALLYCHACAMDLRGVPERPVCWRCMWELLFSLRGERVGGCSDSQE